MFAREVRIAAASAASYRHSRKPALADGLCHREAGERGRYFRVLTIVDQFTRECPLLWAGARQSCLRAFVSS